MSEKFFLKDGTAMSIDNAADHISKLYLYARQDVLRQKAEEMKIPLTQLSKSDNEPEDFKKNVILLANKAREQAGNVHLLGTTGAVSIQDVAISPFNAVVQDIGSNMDTEFELSEFFPELMQTNSQQIVTTLVNAISGQVPQQVPNSPFPTRPKRGYQRLVFQGAGFAEKVDFDEWDLTSVPSFDNWSDLGVLQRFSFEHITSMVRIYTTFKLLIEQVMRTGQYTYFNDLVNYGIPSGNTLAPVGGSGAYWTLDGKTPNAAANPMADFAYWFSDNTQLGLRAEYVRKVIMTRKTFNFYLQNANTKAVDTLSFNNPSLFAGGAESYNNAQRQSAASLGRALFGYNVELVVSDQRWLPETVGANGTITVGNPTYILQDGYIYFGIDTKKFGDSLGSLVFTPNIAKGGIFTPQPGIALGVNDSTLPINGGVFNPTASAYVKANAGVRIANVKNIYMARVF